MRRIALVVAAALIIVVSVGVMFLVPNWGPTVKVTSVNFVGAGTCAVDQTGPGYSVGPGGVEEYSGMVVNSQSDNDCIIDSIVASTPGFTVVDANTPLWVAPGEAAIHWFVRAPSLFDGVLTLNFSGHWFSGAPAPSSVGSSIPGGIYDLHFGETYPTVAVLVVAIGVGAVGATTALALRPRSM